MIRRIRYLSVLVSLLIGLMVTQAQDSDVTPVITLERTPCFGSCPVYTITIFADGTVTYQGENFVDVTGEQTLTLDAATVAMMVETFADAGYFDWQDAYDTRTVSDMPSVITSVTRDGETHRIVRYTGDSAPLALPYLETWIDQMTESFLWTGVQTDIRSISNGTAAPVATLERLPCYGLCPVYNVALYEDGTIVYIGLANVAAMGVHVYQAEPYVISSIVARANGVGYFDWQDSYDEFLMTDQATVITAIQSDDQYKRIVRYEGDPNAPLGLFWTEQSIDRAVESAMATP